MRKELEKLSNGRLCYKWSPDEPGKYPAIIAFDGVGSAGDIANVLREGLPKALEQGLKIPFIVFCAADNNAWITDVEHKPIIDHAYADTNVDTNRVYEFGLSAGGDAILRYLKSLDDRIAAFVINSINANAYTPYVDSMNGRPIRYFHGNKDVSPNLVTSSESFVRAYNKKFGNCHRTVFANRGHNTWDTTYNSVMSETTIIRDGDIAFVPFDMSVFDWILQFTLNTVEQPKPGIYVDDQWIGASPATFEGHKISYI